MTVNQHFMAMLGIVAVSLVLAVALSAVTGVLVPFAWLAISVISGNAFIIIEARRRGRRE